MKRIVLMLIFGMFLFSGQAKAMNGTEASQFEKANLAYRDGKFDEAASLYEALAAKYPHQAVFSYNLGNALQRKGQTGAALLAYERARTAEPRNGDILYNLNYVRNILEYRIEDKRNEAVKIAEKVLSYVKLPELLLFSLVASLLFFGVWAFSLYSSQEFSLLRVVFFSFAILGFALLGVKTVQMNFFREAIVISKEAQVYYGPSINDQQAFKLGEGLKVYVRDSREGWSRIIIASGETGWIQKDQIGEVVS